ncbi:MAG: LysM peptidoglycan-binding domain-containing protein [Myxococcota bacterium]|nr:LysM peptidoglycan-binding domain-containing protein [Myxococcota bacterium]
MSRARSVARRPFRRPAAGVGLALALALPALSAEPAATERVHEVRPGETLWQIAAATIGDPTLWPALYLANRDRIKDPARVYPGQRLAIPRIEPGERAALRREAATLTRRGGPQGP